MGAGRSAVEWADNTEGPAIDNVGIDRGGSHVLVTEKRLNCSDVGACLKKVSREAEAPGMACGSLGEPRRPSSVLHGPLHGRFVEVMNDLQAGFGSVHGREAGKRSCQARLFAAFGIFSRNA